MEAREAGEGEIKGGQGSGGLQGGCRGARDREEREKETHTHSVGNRDVSTDKQLQSTYGRKRGKKNKDEKREEDRLQWE